MKRPVLTLALTLAAFVALAPVAAHATPRTVSANNVVSDSAYATWDFVNGNIGTFVAVVANTQVGTGACKCVAVAVSQYDVNTGNVLITGNAYTDQYTLNVDPQLGSATLQVSNAIFQDDNSFTFFNLDVDLTWTATADAVTQRFHDKFKLPGFIFVSQFNGTSRDAVANGSVLGKSVPNRGDLQFTPVPSSVGLLQHNQSGSFTITTGAP